jgi:hypothetical protein
LLDAQRCRAASETPRSPQPAPDPEARVTVGVQHRQRSTLTHRLSDEIQHAVLLATTMSRGQFQPIVLAAAKDIRAIPMPARPPWRRSASAPLADQAARRSA